MVGGVGRGDCACGTCNASHTLSSNGLVDIKSLVSCQWYSVNAAICWTHMTSLYRNSRSSISSSSFALSFASRSTGWTTSTEWGPGTLAGKALLAIGEAALRGVENLAIRRKLATYKSFFPHTDSDELTEIDVDQMYGDILELTRCGSVTFYLCSISHRVSDQTFTLKRFNIVPADYS